MATTMDPAQAAAGAASGAPAAPQTDEQILGIGAPGAESTPAEPAAPAEQKPGDTAIAQDAGKTPEQKAAEDATAQDAANTVGTLDLRRIPEKYRAMAREDEEFRNLLTAELQWRDLGLKLEDVRAWKEKLPEGVKTLEELVAEKQRADETDAGYYSHDPEMQTPMLARVYESDPEAAVSAFRVMSNIIAEKNPDAYAEIGTELLAATLREQKFDEFAPALAQALADDDGAAIKERAQEISEYLQNYGFGLPRDKQLDQREQRIRQQEQEFSSRGEREAGERYGRFNAEVGAEVQRRNQAAVEDTLASAIPPALKDSHVVKVVMERIVSELGNRLQQDQDLHAQVAAMLRPAGIAPGTKLSMAQIARQMTPETRAKIADLFAEKSKSLIASVAKPYLADLTQQFVSAQNAKNERENKAASRVDVGSPGAPPAPTARPLRPRDIDYRKTSDEQILNM
jgi:hypothetical protein